MTNFFLENFSNNKRTKAIIIAEIGQAHDGSLGTAHAYIDAVADSGADVIKFQTHIADAESTLDEKFRINFSKQDATRFDYWRRMQFTFHQWQELAQHARDRNLIFLSTPFSVLAVQWLTEIGVPAWKIGSGEMNTPDLWEAIKHTHLPILLSTGMSSYAEIDERVHWLQKNSLDFALLQCTSQYPTPLERIGLNVMDEFRQRYSCPVGLSDHSGNIYSSLFALALNADILEVHVTLDKRLFGPDVKASITIDELQQLVEANRVFATLRLNPVNKDAVANELKATKSLFAKSLALAMPLKAGTILEKHHLTLKKPGIGISPENRDKLLGQRLNKDVDCNVLLTLEDLE